LNQVLQQASVLDVGGCGDVVWPASRLTVHLADGSNTLVCLTAGAVREADIVSLRHWHAWLDTPKRGGGEPTTRRLSSTARCATLPAGAIPLIAAASMKPVVVTPTPPIIA
jgi:hypothetical protein